MRQNTVASCFPKPIRVAVVPLYLFIALLLASNPAPAQDERQSRAGEEINRAVSVSSSITGRVVGDDGRPIGDVQVMVYGAYGSGNSRIVTTDSSGRFQINDLAPRPYIIRVNTPGYVQAPDENGNPWETKFIKPGESVQLTLVKGGVITGTILNAQGDPLVAANVRAFRVRDSQGRRIPQETNYGAPRMTDDRGIYRIYGLQPGSYLVVVGGGGALIGAFNPYEADTPTYYPSSTRDTAMEVSVRSGEESTGIDIRYRNERGHSISGTISGETNTSIRYAINIILRRALTGITEAQTFLPDTGGKRVFSLSGIPDGDYEIIVHGFIDRGELNASEPRRVMVRGADVTGLQLALAPLASISGRVTLEPMKEDACQKSDAAAMMQQTLIIIRREDQDREIIQPPIFSTGGSVPNERGEFVLRNLMGGLSRLNVRPPADDWYVRSIVIPAMTRTPADQTKPSEGRVKMALPGTLSFKTGERLTGIQINLAQGAGLLRGTVKAAAEGVIPLANLRAYLVPAESERADDILRYSEAQVAADGSFTFASLAPGRYFVVLRQTPQSELLQPPRLLAWDEEARKGLRREAEEANNAFELKPCQRLTDYQLSYAPK